MRRFDYSDPLFFDMCEENHYKIRHENGEVNQQRRSLIQDTCKATVEMAQLMCEVYECKGKYDVVADVDPAVLSDLPESTIIKNVEYFCEALRLGALTDEEAEKLKKELKDDNFSEVCRPFSAGSEHTEAEIRWRQIELYANQLKRLEHAEDFELNVDNIVEIYRGLCCMEFEDPSDCWDSVFTDDLEALKKQSPTYYEETVRYRAVRKRYICECLHYGAPFEVLTDTVMNRDGQTRSAICETLAIQEIKAALHSICYNFNQACSDNKCKMLAIIPRFFLDFLCISPFKGAYSNFVVGELLTMLLLARCGYPVYRYISFSLTTSRLSSREELMSIISSSIKNWLDGRNKYRKFTAYFLRHLSMAFEYFFYRILPLGGRDRKAKCIKALFKEGSDIQLTKGEIHDVCYEISVPTIESVLGKLSSGGDSFLIKVGKGRNTAYRRRLASDSNIDGGGEDDEDSED